MLNSACSMDESFSEADESNWHDVLADRSAGDEGSVEETVINGVYHQQLHDTLEKCLSSLPWVQEQTIRDRYYNSLTFEQIGKKQGYSREAVRLIEIKALRKLFEERAANGLEAFLDAHTNFYLGVGVKHFKSQRVSSVEYIVMKREELAQRWLKQTSIIESAITKREGLARKHLQTRQAARREYTDDKI